MVVTIQKGEGRRMFRYIINLYIYSKRKLIRPFFKVDEDRRPILVYEMLLYVFSIIIYSIYRIYLILVGKNSFLLWIALFWHVGVFFLFLARILFPSLRFFPLRGLLLVYLLIGIFFLIMNGVFN